MCSVLYLQFALAVCYVLNLTAQIVNIFEFKPII